jgi:hypothetical protein
MYRHHRYFDDTGAASIVLMSHLGRPDGHKVEKYSLKPVVRSGLPFHFFVPFLVIIVLCSTYSWVAFLAF